ncbi:glycosyltransferase family 2 protein [Rufibacter roseus]|uniref:Glycosyltransferase family 2 protein n=1 Tax=Rufibacter roseus TaxID=1567108 RepID=A0ABW2DNY8_9BACT|nr:glycosyltransferase family 2 protein [Rufibacter roseus]
MPAKHLKTSLIISTYNWPNALEVCLKSVLNQERLPDEVIVADDGSKTETLQLIEKYKKDFPVPLKHVWHEDNGFRLSTIRNKAILVAEFEYIIQIDGDLILHPSFIKDHLRLATPQRFVSGSRLLLPPAYSEKILGQRTIPPYLDLLMNGSSRLNAIRVPTLTKLLAPHYKKRNKFYVKGCNMAFWRKDLLEVNGYNENITGWGKEDSELAVRLINNGVKRLFIKFGGICYHLYHREASKARHDLNENILQSTIDSGITRCDKGIDQYEVESITVL